MQRARSDDAMNARLRRKTKISERMCGDIRESVWDGGTKKAN